jgi:hypothetical protein
VTLPDFDCCHQIWVDGRFDSAFGSAFDFLDVVLDEHSLAKNDPLLLRSISQEKFFP